jgi:zinc and cadmium transporter
MNELFLILGATFMVSLISFIGAVTLAMSEKLLRRILIALVGFSAGALMGGAFLHLLPEAIEAQPGALTDIFLVVLASFVMFFILEKLLWRHCHDKACPIHTFAYLNLFGDSVHNFIDGLVIAGSFVVTKSISLGIIATLAVAAHEIPQELGDFGVLIYGGLKPRRALLLNFVTALTAVAGGIGGYYLFPYLGGTKIYLLPFAAGGFLYIAASDLIPELHKEASTARTMVSFVLFLVGIILMLAIKLAFGD